MLVCGFADGSRRITCRGAWCLQLMMDDFKICVLRLSYWGVDSAQMTPFLGLLSFACERRERELSVRMLCLLSSTKRSALLRVCRVWRRSVSKTRMIWIEQVFRLLGASIQSKLRLCGTIITIVYYCIGGFPRNSPKTQCNYGAFKFNFYRVYMQVPCRFGLPICAACVHILMCLPRQWVRSQATSGTPAFLCVCSHWRFESRHVLVKTGGENRKLAREQSRKPFKLSRKVLMPHVEEPLYL